MLWPIAVISLDVGISIDRGYPNGWFVWENLITMDDLGVPPLMEAPILDGQSFPSAFATGF